MQSVSDYFYDEFSFFNENLSEWDLDVTIPPVKRFFVAVDGLRQISGLAWGDGPAELVLLHGGAQNAHTFDTVALALQRPLLAIDLPGHGHSDPSPHGAAAISSHAADIAVVLEELLDGPRPLVGMSLGGLTSLLIAHDRTDLVSSLTLIDITPGVRSNPQKAQRIVDFVNGPASFDDFESLLQRTMAHNPTRSASSLRRGILHNALQRTDGTWVWRHQQHPQAVIAGAPPDDLWTTVAELTVPVTLLRGMAQGSVVDDDDEAEFTARLPHATIVHVPGAGHSIQGDAPLELAALLNRFCT